LNIPDSVVCGHEGKKPRIILAVKDEKRRGAYLAEIGDRADCTLTETLKDIPRLLRQSPCNGILIDIFLKVKASHMDKVRISDSLEAMPSATLNQDSRNGSIKLLMLNQKVGIAQSVDEFTSLCATFHPETIFPDTLCPLHLNAMISPSPEFGGGTEKTFTMFISGSGCFLFTSSPERYPPHTSVWIDFVGISERSPIRGKVCWQCQWGISHNVPGIYVEFESILEGQYDEITVLLKI